MSSVTIINSTIEEELARKGNIVTRNVGDSMMPLLKQDRDMALIVRYEGGLKKYQVPLYRRQSGQYVLHRCLKVNADGTYTMCGDNRYCKEEGVTREQIIGVLDGVYRKGKLLSLDRWTYKVYVHLWCDLFVVRKFLLKVKGRLTRG